jgi:hypothetical protein
MPMHSPKSQDGEPLHRRGKLVMKRLPDGSWDVHNEEPEEKPHEEVAEQPPAPQEDPRSGLGRNAPQHGI